MKPDTFLNGTIGICGTFLASVSTEVVAIIAGSSTACWMLWQLGCGIYDRAKGRHRGPVNFPPK